MNQNLVNLVLAHEFNQIRRADIRFVGQNSGGMTTFILTKSNYLACQFRNHWNGFGAMLLS